jgi:hypothetical protein
MSAPHEHQSAPEPVTDEEAEVLDGLPVLADETEVVQGRLLPAEQRTRAVASERRAPATTAVQAAAAAAGGFVAGAAVIRLVDRRRKRAALASRAGRRTATRRAQGSAGAGSELVQIVGSRSLLLDVHLLAGPGKGS